MPLNMTIPTGNEKDCLKRRWWGSSPFITELFAIKFINGILSISWVIKLLWNRMISIYKDKLIMLHGFETYGIGR